MPSIRSTTKNELRAGRWDAIGAPGSLTLEARPAAPGEDKSTVRLRFQDGQTSRIWYVDLPASETQRIIDEAPAILAEPCAPGRPVKAPAVTRKPLKDDGVRWHRTVEGVNLTRVTRLENTLDLYYGVTKGDRGHIFSISEKGDQILGLVWSITAPEHKSEVFKIITRWHDAPRRLVVPGVYDANEALIKLAGEYEGHQLIDVKWPTPRNPC